MCAWDASPMFTLRPDGCLPVIDVSGCGRFPPFPSLAAGVFQPANHTARPSRALIGTFSHSAPSFQSLVVGVGHPVQSLSDVRRPEARSAGIDCPAGVARSFQVSRYKVEPSEAVLACNLLAKDDWRAALFDKPVEVRP